MPLDTARGGPETGGTAIARAHRCPGAGGPEKTLYGAPAGSVFLDFDQKRALS